MKLSGRFSSLNTEREGDLARLLLGGLIIKSQINMEDIFDDGLPQIQHIVKTEEEIQMFATEEDMNELDRAVHLLRKGYLVQKSAVIGNLASLGEEKAANDKLMPLVINSIPNWDIAMQAECSIAFQSKKLIEALNLANREMLLMQVLEIFGQTDAVLYDKFIEEWFNVMEELLPKLEMHFINLTTLPHIKQMTSMKSDQGSRQLGYRIMCKVLLAHGLSAFESDDLSYRRLIQQMSFDRSWRIRKQFATFLQTFMEPMAEYKNREEMLGQQKVRHADIRQRFPVSMRAKMTKKAFKIVLKEPTILLLADVDEQVAIEGISICSEYYFLFSEMTMVNEFTPRLEEVLCNAIDNRISVSQQARLSRIQGLILYRLKKLGFLTNTLTEQLFHFFSICLREPAIVNTEQSTPDTQDIGHTVKEYYQNKQLESQSVLLNAVYNLPCFYQLLGPRRQTQKWHLSQRLSRLVKVVDKNKVSTMSGCHGGEPETSDEAIKSMERSAEVEANQKEALSPSEATKPSKSQNVSRNETALTYGSEIEKMVIELSHEDKPVEVKRTLAACFHELLKYKHDVESFKRLNKVFENLIRDPLMKESGVQSQLCKNISLIVDNYFIGVDKTAVVKQICEAKKDKGSSLQAWQFTRRRDRRSFMSPEELNPDLKGESMLGKPIQRQGSLSLTRTSSLKNVPRLDTGEDDEEDCFKAERLFQLVPREFIPDDKLDEIAYSQLLEYLVILFDKIIISQGGSRRDCAQFLRAMAPKLHLFNPVEVQDYFLEKLDALITFSCNLVRGSVFYFLSHLISCQYRSEMRMQLIQKVREYVYSSATIQQRKHFILFCTESVRVNTLERDGLFNLCFLPYLVKLGLTEQSNTFAVHRCLVKALPVIHAAIAESVDETGLSQFEQLLHEVEQKNKDNLGTDDRTLHFTPLARQSTEEIHEKRQRGERYLMQLERRQKFEVRAQANRELKRGVKQAACKNSAAKQRQDAQIGARKHSEALVLSPRAGDGKPLCAMKFQQSTHSLRQTSTSPPKADERPASASRSRKSGENFLKVRPNLSPDARKRTKGFSGIVDYNNQEHSKGVSITAQKENEKSGTGTPRNFGCLITPRNSEKQQKQDSTSLPQDAFQAAAEQVALREFNPSQNSSDLAANQEVSSTALSPIRKKFQLKQKVRKLAETEQDQDCTDQAQKVQPSQKSSGSSMIRFKKKQIFSSKERSADAQQIGAPTAARSQSEVNQKIISQTKSCKNFLRLDMVERNEQVQKLHPNNSENRLNLKENDKASQYKLFSPRSRNPETDKSSQIKLPKSYLNKIVNPKSAHEQNNIEDNPVKKVQVYKLKTERTRPNPSLDQAQPSGSVNGMIQKLKAPKANPVISRNNIITQTIKNQKHSQTFGQIVTIDSQSMQNMPLNLHARNISSPITDQGTQIFDFRRKKNSQAVLTMSSTHSRGPSDSSSKLSDVVANPQKVDKLNIQKGKVIHSRIKSGTEATISLRPIDTFTSNKTIKVKVQQRLDKKKSSSNMIKRSGRSSCQSSPGGERKSSELMGDQDTLPRQSTPRRELQSKEKSKSDLLQLSPVDAQEKTQNDLSSDLNQAMSKTPKKRNQVQLAEQNKDIYKKPHVKQRSESGIIIFQSPNNQSSYVSQFSTSTAMASLPQTESISLEQPLRQTSKIKKQSICAPEPDEEPAGDCIKLRLSSVEGQEQDRKSLKHQEVLLDEPLHTALSSVVMPFNLSTNEPPLKSQKGQEAITPLVDENVEDNDFHPSSKYEIPTALTNTSMEGDSQGKEEFRVRKRKMKVQKPAKDSVKQSVSARVQDNKATSESENLAASGRDKMDSHQTDKSFQSQRVSSASHQLLKSSNPSLQEVSLELQRDSKLADSRNLSQHHRYATQLSNSQVSLKRSSYYIKNKNGQDLTQSLSQTIKTSLTSADPKDSSSLILDPKEPRSRTNETRGNREARDNQNQLKIVIKQQQGRKKERGRSSGSVKDALSSEMAGVSIALSGSLCQSQSHKALMQTTQHVGGLGPQSAESSLLKTAGMAPLFLQGGSGLTSFTLASYKGAAGGSTRKPSATQRQKIIPKQSLVKHENPNTQIGSPQNQSPLKNSQIRQKFSSKSFIQRQAQSKTQQKLQTKQQISQTANKTLNPMNLLISSSTSITSPSSTPKNIASTQSAANRSQRQLLYQQQLGISSSVAPATTQAPPASINSTRRQAPRQK